MMVPARMVRDRLFDSVTEKAIVAALAEHADDDGASIYPSLRTIADDTGVSIRTVQRIVTKYRDTGLLVLTAEARQHKPRTYMINLDALARYPLSETGRRRLERQQQRAQSKSPGVTSMSPLASDGEPVRGDIDEPRGDIDEPRGDKLCHPTYRVRPTESDQPRARARDPSPLGGEGTRALEANEQVAGARPWETLSHARLVAAVATRRAERGTTVRIAGITETERQTADAYIQAVERGEVEDVHGLTAPHAIDVWRRHEQRIETEVGEKVWKAWLSMLTPHADDGKTLALAAPSRLIAGIVERDYAELIGKITERRIVIEVHAYAGAAARDRRNPPDYAA